jgi:hypothetical protein
MRGLPKLQGLKIYSYGEVQPQRQADIIRELKSPRGKVGIDEDRIAEGLFRRMNGQHVN